MLKHQQSSKSLIFQNYTEGYLVCASCNGYYRLDRNESPTDFESCECGNPLEYFDTMEEVRIRIYSTGSPESELDYEEMAELLSVIKNKAKQRKEVIQELSRRITIQEELLKEIKAGRWSLWNILEQKDLPSDVKKQKKLLENIDQQEERLMKMVMEKRVRERTPTFQTRVFSTVTDLDPMLYLSIGVILLIIVLVLILIV
ncbi:MAG TPA: hypothetical protein VK444_00580 [Methanobacteriaceae archaeon]|nr:hypothetical protein [Methanobacteriaceae archaeon]